MKWPYDFDAENERRALVQTIINSTPDPRSTAKAHYGNSCITFINDCAITYDPRNPAVNLPARMPLIPFEKQTELVAFVMSLLNDQECGLIEKSRDMGATWMCCAISVWLWLYVDGSSVGWGSRKKQYVDEIGDPDSIFEKIRMIIRAVPWYCLPEGLKDIEHLHSMKCINPANGSTITGEIGRSIGRGGRKSIYFKDESAHYLGAEEIESSLGDNTNVQVDISSVNGPYTIFQKKRDKKSVRVLVMDWKHHPGKSQAWYDKRKKKAELEGLEHIFAQEVDRDSSATVEGAMIPAKYVKAAIDAHIKLKFEASGIRTTALDVADEGKDANALIDVHGVVVTHIDKWHQGDTTVTAQKAFKHALGNKSSRLIYDKIGVGAGVKGETNRLKKTPEYKDAKIEVSGFNAGSKKLYKPNQTFMEGTKNKEMFCNIKAQMWWLLRLRFVKTYNAVTNGVVYPPDELISIPSNLKYHDDLVQELSQPKEERDGEGKIKVQAKADSSNDSENFADALVEAFLPFDYTTQREVRVMVVGNN